MNDRVERSFTAAIAVDGDATTRRTASPRPEPRESRDGAAGNESPVPVSERQDTVAVPGTRSVSVMNVDLGELLASVEAAIGEVGAIYSFDDCELHTGARSLTRSGRPVHLRPKVYHLLVHLLEHRHRAVSRDELCAVVWNGRCVGNATVDSTVKTLRHAVGDDGGAQRVVRTHNGYGYRFVAKVAVSGADAPVSRSVLLCPSGREGLRIRLDGPPVRENPV